MSRIGKQPIELPGGEKKIMFIRELASFRIIDHEDVHMLEGFAKFGGSAFDPIVHGIESDEFWLAFYLFENTALKSWGDVGKEDMRGLAEFFRKLGIEIGEHIQFGDQGFAFV